MAVKIAVVTGANRGLGLAIVRGLCERLSSNDVVYLTARDEKRGLHAVKQLTDLDLPAAFHQLDITDKTSVQNFADFIKNKHGGFDYLVNNAAIMDYDELYPSYEVAKRNIDVNFKSLLTVEEYLYPLLKDGARVVNISSACGHLSNLRNETWIEMLKKSDLTTEKLNEFVGQYLESVKNGTFRKEDFADDGKHAEHRVSKIAVTALTMIQARKYASRHISINALYPGHLHTEMARGGGVTPPETGASLVLYLLLDASPELTGTFMWHDRKLVDWYDHEGDYYYVHKDLDGGARRMASFAAQAALRSKWGELLDSTPEPDVGSGVRSVVGWLKQASLEVRAAGTRAVSTLRGAGAGGATSAGNMDDTILLLHYNDVYNIEQTTNTEPVGGAMRFSSAVKSLQHKNPLVLFSGDAFSPSMLSAFTKGEQMVPVLNEVGTHCAVFGNHDFDFGLEVLSGLVAQCKFPWLMSNVVDRETGRPLGDGRITHAEECGSHRIGFIGLVEQEWLETLATINPEEVTYIDFVQAGNQLASQLKQEGCEMVIALTHMRTRNDVKLAEGCADIDLILGGHDHVYEVQEVNNKLIVKSGTDFRQFSQVTLQFGAAGSRPRVSVEAHDVTSEYPEDPLLKAVLDKYTAMVEGKMDDILGRFSVPLEGRFSLVRRAETNLGNWVCDVALAATNADLVILNSGTFRSDRVHPAGAFTLRDLAAVIPMRDPLVVVRATGAEILQALENAVSKYPSLEGRFPQVAGISFAFDPSKPAGARVVERFVKIGDEYLVRAQHYRLCIKQYLHGGSDGFTMLRDCPVLVEEDMCPEIGLCIQNHFAAINVRTGKSRHSRHRQSLVTLSRRHSLVKMLDSVESTPTLRRASSTADPPAPPHTLHSRLTRRASLDDLEQQSCELAPRVEGRIILLDSPEKLSALEAERARQGADTVIREVDEPDH